MMVRQDWVTPVFNGELRVHKPVLLYWLIMSATRPAEPAPMRIAHIHRPAARHGQTLALGSPRIFDVGRDKDLEIRTLGDLLV